MPSRNVSSLDVLEWNRRCRLHEVVIIQFTRNNLNESCIFSKLLQDKEVQQVPMYFAPYPSVNTSQ